jgi:cobalt-zinc-cadmium efflux system protein
LFIAFGLVMVFMVVEAAAGFLTGSLALISDAGHMATDALGLGMALAAIVAADRAAGGRGHTYGLYRLEILAALANAVLLFGVAGYVIYEAAHRLQEPTEVLTTPMLLVAIAGLVVNVIGWRLLREGAQESINVQGAYLEVIADLAGSIGVITAALIMIFTEWPYADPLFATLIGLFILPRSWRLGHQALRVLVQAAPAGLNLDTLRADLSAIGGVVDVHDLHVWTLTSEMDVATVHLMTRNETDPHPVLDQARKILQDRYHIAHATLQVEPDTHHGCSEVTW